MFNVSETKNAMNRKQSNYFNMAKAVCDVLNNSEAWKNMEMMAESVGKIGELCRKIDEEAVKQQRHRSAGFTESKKRERILLEERLHHLSMCLKVYAARNADGVLAARVKTPRSILGVMRLDRLLTVARVVAESAAELGARLESYGVSQAEIAALNKAIAATAELNAHRDAVRVEHAENTAHLAILISGLRRELKLMDMQVKAFIEDQDFVRTYFFVRRIHDRG